MAGIRLHFNKESALFYYIKQTNSVLKMMVTDGVFACQGANRTLADQHQAKKGFLSLSGCSLILIIAWGLLLPAFGTGQPVWSLNECIAYAMEHNPAALRNAIQEELAAEDYNQAKRNLLPYVGAGTNAGVSFGRSVDPNTNLIVNTEFFNNSYYLNGSLDLFRGWMQQNQIRYRKLMRQMREYERQQHLDGLAFSIMNDFFDIIYFRELVEIAGEQVKLSELSLQRAERMSEAGLKAKTDLLEVTAWLEQEKLFKIQAENRLETAILSLRQKMNLPPEEPFQPGQMDLPTAVTGYIPENTEKVYEQFATFSPGLLSAETGLESGKQYVGIARSRYYPSLTFNASVNSGFFETNRDNLGRTIPFGNQFRNNLSQFTGISMQIPVFNRGGTRSEVRKAQLYKEEAETWLEQARQQVWFEIQNNNQELASLSREMEQIKRRMEADELAFQAAEKKFDQGLISTVEYFTAKNRLATTRSQSTQVRLKWEVKKRTNEFFLGERFWTQ
jgi:outer membrane protein